MNRKLATLRKVKALQPIPGADRIECAIVDGWQVVVKKGEFSVGQHVVYFEIDSLMPIDPAFEFLRPTCHTTLEGVGEGFRPLTVKMRGQVFAGASAAAVTIPSTG